MTTRYADFFAPLAKSGITRRFALRALPLAVAVALTIGAVAGPEAAFARPVGGTGSGCTYNGIEYSEGSIIQFENGYWYKCKDGKWEYHGSIPNPVTSQPVTVNPGWGTVPDQNITVDPGRVVLEDTDWAPLEVEQP